MEADHQTQPPTYGTRIGLGRRVAAVALALVLEALLLLVLLTLGQSYGTPKADEPEVATFDVSSPEPVAEPEPEPEEAQPEAEPVPREVEPEQPPPPQPVRPAPAPVPAPLQTTPPPAIELPRPVQRPAAPPAAARPVYGPPDTGPPGPPDSARVGTAPNGEPLYAARWYREPYPDELTGYLSTATGPGWGLIACRTAPDWRVEDCVALGESPRGSNIARSVLAASWQFKVRPPRVGGRSMVGEWVRIRIDYGLQRQQP